MRFDRVLIGALILAGVVEGVSLLVDRRVLGIAAGVVLAAIVLVVCGLSTDTGRFTHIEPAAQSQWEEAVSRWRTRSVALLRHIDGSRGEWDRHIRPVLAQEFQLSIGYRAAIGPAELSELGSIALGPDLWVWVDPSAVAVSAWDQPGPGRATFVRIIDRMERM